MEKWWSTSTSTCRPGRALCPPRRQHRCSRNSARLIIGRRFVRIGRRRPLPDARKEHLMGDDILPSALRIWEHCEGLARCSEQADGLTRVFLSKEQRAASDLVLRWMRHAGMTAKLDEIGNCVGRYEGDRPGSPCLALGSHLDTVRAAGKYDGMLGVVAAH